MNALEAVTCPSFLTPKPNKPCSDMNDEHLDHVMDNETTSRMAVLRNEKYGLLSTLASRCAFVLFVSHFPSWMASFALIRIVSFPYRFVVTQYLEHCVISEVIANAFIYHAHTSTCDIASATHTGNASSGAITVVLELSILDLRSRFYNDLVDETLAVGMAWQSKHLSLHL